MVNNNDGNVTDEVENRLRDLFGDSDESPAFVGNSRESVKSPVRKLEEVSEGEGDRGALEDFPLRELEAVVLSVDWEISDEIMNDLIEEVDGLKNTYKDDKTILLFLQLLGSVGKYIRTNKAAAHPDSITLLNSIYYSLEKVMLSKGMTEAERKKTLLAQVKKFKQLKAQIGRTKAPSPGILRPSTGERVKDTGLQEESRPGGETMQEVVRPDMGRMPPHEAFAFAIEEIKEVIKAEFKALRAELKLWREGQ